MENVGVIIGRHPINPSIPSIPGFPIPAGVTLPPFVLTGIDIISTLPQHPTAPVYPLYSHLVHQRSVRDVDVLRPWQDPLLASAGPCPGLRGPVQRLPFRAFMGQDGPSYGPSPSQGHPLNLQTLQGPAFAPPGASLLLGLSLLMMCVRGPPLKMDTVKSYRSMIDQLVDNAIEQLDNVDLKKSVEWKEILEEKDPENDADVIDRNWLEYPNSVYDTPDSYKAALYGGAPLFIVMPYTYGAAFDPHPSYGGFRYTCTLVQ